MQANFDLTTNKSPVFTALRIRESVLKQANKRVPIGKLDETLTEIRATVENYRKCPVDIDIFCGNDTNKLTGIITYGKYIKVIQESSLSAFLKRNPVKFIKKCCEDAQMTRESFMI